MLARFVNAVIVGLVVALVAYLLGLLFNALGLALVGSVLIGNNGIIGLIAGLLAFLSDRGLRR